MGAKKPKAPQETPGVIVGDRGFALAQELSELTGQTAQSFRIRGAAEAPQDVAGYLEDLLQTTKKQQAVAAEAAKAAKVEGTRRDPAVQAAAKATTAALRHRSRGRASTILTALSAKVPTSAVGRKTLLGG